MGYGHTDEIHIISHDQKFLNFKKYTYIDKTRPLIRIIDLF